MDHKLIIKDHIKSQSTTGIKKKITAAANKAGCESLKAWAHAISTHMYWCAISSKGNGSLARARWLSMMKHIVNVHEDCVHAPLTEEREWLKLFILITNFYL